MKYQTGRPGRVIVAKFDDNDEVLGTLTDLIKKEDIRSGVLYLIGGLKQGRIVVGPETEELPPVPVWKELTESHEILGFGTVFWLADEPKIHLHSAFGKKDMVKVGCLRADAKTFLVLEAVIMELDGINAVREVDPAIGLPVLKL
ncbi:DNA-binding protein [bacterium]|nr:DNA-binding protein [bacterium]